MEGDEKSKKIIRDIYKMLDLMDTEDYYNIVKENAIKNDRFIPKSFYQDR